MILGTINKELERIWKKAAVANLRYFSDTIWRD
jgi:hypothetical protein